MKALGDATVIDALAVLLEEATVVDMWMDNGYLVVRGRAHNAQVVRQIQYPEQAVFGDGALLVALDSIWRTLKGE